MPHSLYGADMPKEEIPVESLIRDTRMKLQGIAYFLQSTDTNVPTPFDLGDCFYGIGEIINECAESLRSVADEVARLTFVEAKLDEKKKKRKKKS